MKILKRIGMTVAAIAALSLIFCAAACGEEKTAGGEKLSYSVTVVDPAGEPVKGIKVKWGNNKTEYPTLESGKASAELAGGDYDITLPSLPEIYKYENPVKATATDRDKTVALEWNPEDGMLVYTVKVLLPDGNPLKGAKVELCIVQADGTLGSCSPFPAATNSKGEAYSIGELSEGFYTRGLTPGTYRAKILSGITGYTYEKDANDYYIAEVATADKPSLTIALRAE